MCGRYTLRSRGKAKPYGVPESQLPLLSPRYNIAPSQDVPVILGRKNGREMAVLVKLKAARLRLPPLIGLPSETKSVLSKPTTILAEGLIRRLRWGKAQRSSYGV